MTRTASSRNHLIRISVLSILVLALAFIPFDALFDPDFSICIHYKLLGIECPLCGMTRAVHQFAHFRFVSALQYNAVVVLLPFYLAFDIVTYFTEGKIFVVLKKLVVVCIAIGLLILYAFRIASHFQWI